MALEQRTEKKRVLIFWTGNSATSQMAEGLLRNDAGGYLGSAHETENKAQ
jgi:protein-tyrosine-phosphatase